MEALKAAEELAKEGLEAEVINNHTIKPMDKDTILKSVKKTGCVVTIEEHQAAGGMGSAVSEILSQNYPRADGNNRRPRPLRRIGRAE